MLFFFIPCPSYMLHVYRNGPTASRLGWCQRTNIEEAKMCHSTRNGSSSDAFVVPLKASGFIKGWLWWCLGNDLAVMPIAQHRNRARIAGTP